VSMTRRFSISLPDDVAAELDHVDNASAYIAEAIRLRRRSEAARNVLANAGYRVTDEGIQHMRERVHGLEARRTQLIEAGEE
jgi:metal-responsive CopG/Arc/MetJ family transcriptional regulator